MSEKLEVTMPQVIKGRVIFAVTLDKYTTEDICATYFLVQFVKILSGIRTKHVKESGKIIEVCAVYGRDFGKHSTI